MGGWCQFDDLTAVNSTKFSIERVSKNHCPEYLKGIRGVAEYVQLPGDDGQCRRHGRLYRHDAELGGRHIASERTAPSRACQGDLGMSHQDWQAQWNQAMEALARAYRRCRRALRQIGVLERPVGDSSNCGTIRVGSFRGRWLDPRHAGPATAADAGD